MGLRQLREIPAGAGILILGAGRSDAQETPFPSLRNTTLVLGLAAATKTTSTKAKGA